MIIDEEVHLAHYGILRRSGRYPWGSSGNESTRNKKFLDIYEDFKRQGVDDVAFCQYFGIGTTDRHGKFHSSTTQLRAAKAVAKNEQKMAQIGQAQRLKDKGYSNGAIAAKMKLPGESSVRALLAPGAADKAEALISVSKMLQSEVDDKKWVDVGSGVENHIGVSKEKLNQAVFMLKEKGYEVHTVPIPQIGVRGNKTRTKVLALPGTTQHDAWKAQDDIQQLSSRSDDGGRSFPKKHDPVSIGLDRVQVRFSEKDAKDNEIGGGLADGVIYVRPGLKDLSLGGKSYAQVRIKVGDEHFLKGMAVYKDDLPKGVDLLFNTSKTDTGTKTDAMKPIGPDPDFPFESVVRPLVLDINTEHERVESAMNIVFDEGKWNEWQDTLSSQMLSKQSPELAKEQLDVTYNRRVREYDEIMALTNPAVKKKLLEAFADGTDAAASNLKAASMPRQNWRVVLPMETLPPTQVYAPTFRDGERVVLVRFPHGGTFEIPELVVNNRHPDSKRLLGDVPDAIGIHPAVAERLSGADFDGDTVLVIPNNSGKVKTSPAIEGLKNFDPRASYPPYEGMKPMTGPQKQNQMGVISNLITDMTLQGASHAELARAVRHSMVVIDAEKHNLNYRQSAIDNGINQLKEVYQGKKTGGASTIISRKKQYVWRPETKPRPQSEGGPVDRITGRKERVPTGKVRKNKDGSEFVVKEKVLRIAITDDAHELVSEANTRMERLYADYSNRQKALANQARLDALKTPPVIWRTSAKKVYSSEVASLKSKLALAKRNRSLERQALIIANANVRQKKAANPHLEKDSIRKLEYQELANARIRTKVDQTKIEIDQDEWDAIQAGAISNSELTQILAKANLETVRELATPRVKLLMTPSKTQRAQSMLATGATRAEIADALGVSMSTLDRSLKQE